MNASESKHDKPGRPWAKIAVLVVVAALITVVYVRYRNNLTLSYFAQREAGLRDLQSDQPLLVYGLAFAIYVLVTGLSLPGATIMTLFIGWYFGLWRGVILVSFASTLGATMAFFLSRYLLRGPFERRFGKRLAAFNEALDREGAFYLFTLRLIPAVPFFVINVVMGLTHIRVWTFWWVSQVGMLAGTVVYTYAGSQVPDLQTLADKGAQAVFNPTQLTSLTIAFVLLGVFPLAVKKILAWLRPATASPSLEQDKDDD